MAIALFSRDRIFIRHCSWCSDHAIAARALGFVQGFVGAFERKTCAIIKFIWINRAFVGPPNGSQRDECLNVHWFETINDARHLIEAWRIDYNESRPHMALGNIPPGEYALRARTSTAPKGSNAVGN